MLKYIDYICPQMTTSQTASKSDLLQVTKSFDWLQVSKDYEWLQVTKNYDWLQVTKGFDWLQVTKDYEWLQVRIKHKKLGDLAWSVLLQTGNWFKPWIA